MCDIIGNDNFLTVTNLSRASKLRHNVFSTIPLAKKSFEVFLRKLVCPSKLYFKGKVVGLANIIESQYVVRLAKDPESATIYIEVSSSIKTWFARLAHLIYKAIIQIASMALGIQLKSFFSEKICRGCMVSRQQHKLSRESMTFVTKF